MEWVKKTMTNLCDPRPLFELFVEVFVVLPKTPVSRLYFPSLVAPSPAQRPSKATVLSTGKREGRGKKGEKKRPKQRNARREKKADLYRVDPQPGQGVGPTRGEREGGVLYTRPGMGAMVRQRSEKAPYLRVVQLVLSHNLDGAFATRLALDGLVDIRESTVAHLFDQTESL